MKTDNLTKVLAVMHGKTLVRFYFDAYLLRSMVLISFSASSCDIRHGFIRHKKHYIVVNMSCMIKIDVTTRKVENTTFEFSRQTIVTLPAGYECNGLIFRRRFPSRNDFLLMNSD